MKLLLTGLPGVGKSTIIGNVRNSISDCMGILAREQRLSGERVGFTVENQQGQSKPFMRKVNEPSKDSIGIPGHYYEVDVDVIDTFVVSELERSLDPSYSGLTYIDEIGRAQMKSARFVKVVEQLLLHPKKDILATIVYKDDSNSPSLKFKNYPHVYLLKITAENRDKISNILISAFKNANLFKKLTVGVQKNIYDLLINFVENKKYASAEKIFTNSLDYFINNRLVLVEKENSVIRYMVYGKTKNHHVSYHKDSGSLNCDCDLTHGVGIYKGLLDEICSHKITVLLKNSQSSEPSVRGMFFTINSPRLISKDSKHEPILLNPDLTVRRSRL